ncbi:MAG TPA: lysine exporter LysO family protein [Eubacteriaceae bacterium]|nr:lysine exporter LysO family protein [Eubacteriaceae bacterium]
MILLIIFLILGLIIGLFDIVPEKYMDKIKLVPTISIIFILFLMGSKIGMNPKIIQNINIIGLKALILTIGSIAGSLLFIKIFLSRMNFSLERQEENE